MTFNPGANPFRLRIGIDTDNAASGEFKLYAKKNSGSYAAVTTSSTGGVQSYDASSDADDTIIRVPRLYPFSPDWQLSGAAIDLDFAGNRIYPYGALFTPYLSCSRASVGYATNVDGTLMQFGTDTLRIGIGTGLLVEDARTNIVLWCCDLTNAAWTPSNVTPLKDQTGPDGVANSASSLLATAGNGTILQSITDASKARFQSAYVKRLVGSGTINMTMDNGSTWTAISPTSDWSQLSIPTQTLANPTVGFRIVTSGDKIAVAFVQNENGVFASSAISTTTTSATRAADVPVCIGDANNIFNNRPMSAVLSWQNSANSGGLGLRVLWPSSNANYVISNPDTDFASAVIWASISKAVAGSGTEYTGAKVGIAQDTTNGSVVLNAGTVSSGASPGVMPDVALLTQSGGTNNCNFGYVRRLTLWNSKLADATLQSLTAP